MRRHGSRALIALVLLGLAWLASGLGAAALLTTRHGLPADEPAPPGFESVRLSTSDGLAIGAWLRPVAEPRAAVVMVHGNGSSRSALADEARALSEHGLTVMPVTLRAHGDSDGWRNDIGWSARLDVVAAVDYLRALTPETPVFVHGKSLGAAAAIFAAPELGDRVAGYVLVAPYSDLDLAVERRVDRYLPPGMSTLAYGALWVGGRALLPDADSIAPVQAAARFPPNARALIVAGGADASAPPSAARAIARAMPGGARVVVLEGEGHAGVARAVATERLGLVLELVTGRPR